MDLLLSMLALFSVLATLFVLGIIPGKNKIWAILPLALAIVIFWKGPAYLDDNYKWHEEKETFTATQIPGITGITFAKPMKITKTMRKREKCYVEIWSYVVDEVGVAK